MKLQLAVLNRRGVFKTLAGYAVVSWVLIEVTSVIGPAFLLPDWSVAALTTALVLGCLPVLLLSWRYEFTSEGIKRDTRVAPDDFDFSAKSLLALIVILLLAITASLWVNYYRSQSISEVERLLAAQQGAPEIETDGQIRSIAVLPFDDYSPGGGQGLLADGISEAILHVLAQNKDLVVTSRKSSFVFRDKDVSAAEIGRILNVQTLLEGSIQIVKDQLRVTSQLIRTSDQTHIWSNVYEAPLEDIFKVNDEIALEVRNLILPEKIRSQDMHGQPHPPSIEAFQLLLEARELIGDAESTERAIRLIRVIIQLWPDYAAAWGWLAMAYDDKAGKLFQSHTASGVEIDETWNKSMEAADTALELNPNNHLALLIKGRASADSGAEGYHEAISKVLDAAPNDPDVLNWLASLALYTANYKSAEKYLARARAVEPRDYDIFENYLLSICGAEAEIPMMESQLQDYPTSKVKNLYFRSFAQFCDRHWVESVTTTIKLSRIDSEPDAAFNSLIMLAALGHEEALELMGSVHRLLPREFNNTPGQIMNPSYFTEILPERLETYRGHLDSEFASTSTRIMYAITLIMAGEYTNAEFIVDAVKSAWEGFYASEGGRFWQGRTLTIYAYKAWLLAQRGEFDKAARLSAELLGGLEEKEITRWSGSRGRLDDIPLMILLLNGRQQQAVDWLLDAEENGWLFFQPVLTSPVYGEFRELPQVSEALARMVDWRVGILDELMLSGLPEVEDPGLLLELLESLVTPTHHDRAQVALHFDHDPANALRHYQEALKKEPGNTAILRQMAGLALEYGLVDEAIVLDERVVSQSPMDPEAHSYLGLDYACAQRWNDAISSVRKSLELAPGTPRIQRLLGMMLILNDEPGAAMQIISQIENELHRRMGRILAYHALGEQEKSDTLLQEWEEEGWENLPILVAYTLAYRGEADLAFEMLHKAASIGQVSVVAVHPFLLSLHDDPRWLPFLESIGKSPGQLAGIEINLTSH